MTKTKGYLQLQAIITEIMTIQDYPSWELTNGVLSCEKVLGNNRLWFWFGQLRIVRGKKNTTYFVPKYTKAGDMPILEEWNTESDGTITLIGVEK